MTTFRRNPTVRAKDIVYVIINALGQFQKDQEPEDVLKLVVIKIDSDLVRPELSV